MHKHQRIALQKALLELPKFWALVPVRGKRPMGKRWNKNPYTPALLAQALNCFKNCTGIGLLTGTPVDANGNIVVAVDQDGAEAKEMLQVITGGSLPKTVAFTSGKPDRCQRLYKVAPSIKIRTCKFPQGLEIRCTGLMSVLPPSIHPETRQPYKWLPSCSPAECRIAPAPFWLVELLTIERSHTPNKRQQRLRTQEPNSPCALDYTQAARKYPAIVYLLSKLAPERADDYHEWIRIGLCLRSHSPELLPLWDWWSRQSPKYKPGECQKLWEYFKPEKISLGTLYYLAEIDSPRK